MQDKPNPSGLCQCGCGTETPLARYTDSRSGLVKGEPTRFIRGHCHKIGLPPEFVVDSATACWVWQRKRSRWGYGQAYSGGVRVAAHRVYYERFVGPIPAGLQLDHLCRNHACVNPAHLEPVTNAENARRGASAKLTAADVVEIRASGEVGPVLAKRFGVNKSAIYKIRRGERWAPERTAA